MAECRLKAGAPGERARHGRGYSRWILQCDAGAAFLAGEKFDHRAGGRLQAAKGGNDDVLAARFVEKQEVDVNTLRAHSPADAAAQALGRERGVKGFFEFAAFVHFAAFGQNVDGHRNVGEVGAEAGERVFERAIRVKIIADERRDGGGLGKGVAAGKGFLDVFEAQEGDAFAGRVFFPAFGIGDAVHVVGQFGEGDGGGELVLAEVDAANPPAGAVFAEGFVEKQERDLELGAVVERLPSGVPDREVDALLVVIDGGGEPDFRGGELDVAYAEAAAGDGAGLAAGVKGPALEPGRAGEPMAREDLPVHGAFAGEGEGVAAGFAGAEDPGEAGEEFIDLGGDFGGEVGAAFVLDGLERAEARRIERSGRKRIRASATGTRPTRARLHDQSVARVGRSDGGEGRGLWIFSARLRGRPWGAWRRLGGGRGRLPSAGGGLVPSCGAWRG